MQKNLIYKLFIVLAVIMPVVIFGLQENKVDLEPEEASINFDCLKNEVAVVFNFLDEYKNGKIAFIDSEIKKIGDKIGDIDPVDQVDQAKIEKLKEIKTNFLHQFDIINFIVNRDIESLKNVDPARFSNSFWVTVDGDKFENNLEGRLSAYDLGGSSMLAWVLFHSAINATKEDNEKTLEMLEIILGSGVDVNLMAGRTYWIKKKVEDSVSYDYNVDFPLIEIAVLYSFPQAVELLLKYGAKFIKRRVEFCVHCRTISGLINDSAKNGMPSDQLEKLKNIMALYLHVLEGIMIEGIAAYQDGQDGQDNISTYDHILCKYASQAL